jgi:hypothetical protein
MPEENNISETDSTFSVIQRIKSGSLDPKLLDKEHRLLCVEALYLEGVTPMALAELFKVNDRTIRRDMQEIRIRNSLNPNPELVKQIIGDFWLNASAHRNHLMKLARGKDGSVGERAQAEYYASRTTIDIVSVLQSIGYIPKMPGAVAVLHATSPSSESITLLLKELDEMQQLEPDTTKQMAFDKIKAALPQEKKP